MQKSCLGRRILLRRSHELLDKRVPYVDLAVSGQHWYCRRLIILHGIILGVVLVLEYMRRRGRLKVNRTVAVLVSAIGCLRSEVIVYVGGRNVAGDVENDGWVEPC